MSEYEKFVTGAGDQYLAALAEVQDRFLKMLALSPAWAAAAYPMGALRFPTEPPTPRQIIETNFTFVEKWLKQQKAFADRLFGMVATRE
jgi:hypothetical protein